MQKYYVDLRSFTPEEAKRIYALIHYTSFDTYLIAGLPYVYEVMWNQDTPISVVAGIPDNLVSFYPPHNN